MDLKRLDWILIKAQSIKLNAWEQNFINEFTERRERLGDALTVSEAQEEILERISAK